MKPTGSRTLPKVVLLIVSFFLGFWPVSARADIYLNHLYVTLSWQPNTELDIQGYEVHRSNAYGGPYAKANSGLIAGTSWTDTNVTDGSTYYYKLRAVDMCGNIGEFSPPSDAVIIRIVEDEVTIVAGPSGSPNPAASEGTVNCSVTASDALGHSLTYQWSATGGAFTHATARSPVWNAPVNSSGAIKDYAISVVVTCSGGQWIGGSYTQEVLPNNNESPVAEAGADQLVQGSASVTLNGCASHDPDNAPSPLTYRWRQTSGKTTVTLSGANTCSSTFTAPAENDTLTFTLTVNDGVVSDVDTVTVTVDAEPPEVLPEELGPYPQQGLDGNMGAATDTCIRARVLDNIGINLVSSTCKSQVTAYAIYSNGSSERFEQLIGHTVSMETDPDLVWLMFVPDYKTTYGSGLPHGFTVGVTVETCDLAGNSMEPYSYRFKVRDSIPHLPNQTRSEDPHPSQPGDVLSVTLQEGDMAGAWMEYPDTVAVEPYFGPADELPDGNLNGGANALSLNLQPPTVFSEPVKLFIPLPGEKDLTRLKVYHYDPNPGMGWQEAAVGDGWLEYREDHQTPDPPTIELWINHFTGLLLEATDGTNPSSSGGGGGGRVSGCFIATAAYGSPNAGDVLIFREFRDKYMLTNPPGRIFVRLYYRFSPPMARFIAKREHLRAAIRCILSPLASACKLVLTSPRTAKHIALAVALTLAAALWGGLVLRRKERKA